MQMPLFHDMFYLGLPVAEKILRPILVYAFRRTGRRHHVFPEDADARRSPAPGHHQKAGSDDGAA